MPRDDVAGIRPGTPPEPVGRGFLHGRDDLAATALLLFFIELGSRRVHVAGCTPNPSAAWVIQQARQFSWTLAERSEPLRFLIRDRDQKFTDRFDDVFRSDGVQVVRTPFRAPQASGVAKRFVRTARTECLDWLLVLNQPHLEWILEVFVNHYNDVSYCPTSLCA
jgi:putative transposase